MFSCLGWFVWRFRYLGVIIATFRKITFVEIKRNYGKIKVSLITRNYDVEIFEITITP